MRVPVAPIDDGYRVIAAEAVLPPNAARRLRDLGFVVLPGPAIEGGPERLAQAYDTAVATADPRDVSVRSSTRVLDFVNRGPAFDGLYVYRPLLAACCQIIGRPFKLSTMLARTLEPGTPAKMVPLTVPRKTQPLSSTAHGPLKSERTSTLLHVSPRSSEWKTPLEAGACSVPMLVSQTPRMVEEIERSSHAVPDDL